MNIRINSPFKLPIRIIKFFGMWMDKDSSKSFILYGCAMHLMFIDLFLVMEIAYLSECETMENFANLMSLMPTYIAFFFKSLNVLLNSSKVKEIIERTDELLLICSDNSLVEKQIKTVNKILKFQLVTGLTTCFVGALLSVYQLPQKMLFPYDVSSGLGYWISAVYQSLGTFCMVPVAISLDILIVLPMCYAAAFVTIINNRLQSLENKRSQSQKLAEDDIRELIKCVKIQKKIDEYMNLFHETFSTVLLIQGMMSTLILCTTSISLSAVSLIFILLTFSNILPN